MKPDLTEPKGWQQTGLQAWIERKQVYGQN